MMNVNKILVPIDYSDHSTLALQWGISLAQKYGAHILLLHVIPKAVEEVSTQGPGASLYAYPPVDAGMGLPGPALSVLRGSTLGSLAQVHPNYRTAT